MIHTLLLSFYSRRASHTSGNGFFFFFPTTFVTFFFVCVRRAVHLRAWWERGGSACTPDTAICLIRPGFHQEKEIVA